MGHMIIQSNRMVTERYFVVCFQDDLSRSVINLQSEKFELEKQVQKHNGQETNPNRTTGS